MLTIAQRERLNVVIDNDCEIRYKYSDAKGATCALGGMAKAIGIWYPSEGMASNNTEVPVPGVWVIKPTKNRYIGHMANELCNFPLSQERYKVVLLGVLSKRRKNGFVIILINLIGS